jgi:hypothetical protein
MEPRAEFEISQCRKGDSQCNLSVCGVFEGIKNHENITGALWNTKNTFEIIISPSLSVQAAEIASMYFHPTKYYLFPSLAFFSRNQFMLWQ